MNLINFSNKYFPRNYQICCQTFTLKFSLFIDSYAKVDLFPPHNKYLKINQG